MTSAGSSPKPTTPGQWYREWYFLSMITVPPFAATDNDRYPDLRLTSLDDYLTQCIAHQS